jgi:hypothetical protein
MVKLSLPNPKTLFSPSEPFLTWLDFMEFLTKDFIHLNVCLISLSYLGKLTLLKFPYTARLHVNNNVQKRAIISLIGGLYYNFGFVIL